MRVRRTVIAAVGALALAAQAGCSILYDAGSEEATLSRPVDAATVEAAVRRVPGVGVVKATPAEPRRVFFVIPAGTDPESISFTDAAAPGMLGWVRHPPGSAEVSVETGYPNREPTDRERSEARGSIGRVVEQLRRAADQW